MSTKIRVETLSSDNLDDWDELLDDAELDRGKRRHLFNGRKRRQIEDALEERRLQRQIASSFDEDYYDEMSI